MDNGGKERTLLKILGYGNFPSQATVRYGKHMLFLRGSITNQHQIKHQHSRTSTQDKAAGQRQQQDTYTVKLVSFKHQLNMIYFVIYKLCIKLRYFCMYTTLKKKGPKSLMVPGKWTQSYNTEINDFTMTWHTHTHTHFMETSHGALHLAIPRQQYSHDMLLAAFWVWVWEPFL